MLTDCDLGTPTKQLTKYHAVLVHCGFWIKQSRMDNGFDHSHSLDLRKSR